MAKRNIITFSQIPLTSTLIMALVFLLYMLSGAINFLTDLPYRPIFAVFIPIIFFPALKIVFQKNHYNCLSR